MTLLTSYCLLLTRASASSQTIVECILIQAGQPVTCGRIYVLLTNSTSSALLHVLPCSRALDSGITHLSTYPHSFSENHQHDCVIRAARNTDLKLRLIPRIQSNIATLSVKIRWIFFAFEGWDPISHLVS